MRVLPARKQQMAAWLFDPQMVEPTIANWHNHTTIYGTHNCTKTARKCPTYMPKRHCSHPYAMVVLLDFPLRALCCLNVCTSSLEWKWRCYHTKTNEQISCSHNIVTWENWAPLSNPSTKKSKSHKFGRRDILVRVACVPIPTPSLPLMAWRLTEQKQNPVPQVISAPFFSPSHLLCFCSHMVFSLVCCVIYGYKEWSHYHLL